MGEILQRYHDTPWYSSIVFAQSLQGKACQCKCKYKLPTTKEVYKDSGHTAICLGMLINVTNGHARGIDMRFQLERKAGLLFDLLDKVTSTCLYEQHRIYSLHQRISCPNCNSPDFVIWRSQSCSQGRHQGIDTNAAHEKWLWKAIEGCKCTKVSTHPRGDCKKPSWGICCCPQDWAL